MADIESLVAEFTLDEKCAFVAGRDLWHTPGSPRLGIRPLKVSDGPVGVRGDQWSGTATSTSFPCGSALGATWDERLVGEVGACLGREARDKGVHVVLGPTVNLHRTPLAGRNFECYSEDPLLSGRLAVAWIRGIQSQRVGCTVKHFVANDQEHERMSISAELDRRTLHELYLRPFELAVRDGGAWGVMSAYNRVHGTYCGEHPQLLTDVLRGDWGFDGFVISDWFGTHSTAAAASAGLDLEMPGPPQWFGGKLADAVRAGEVDEAVVDAMVRRLLRLYERTGALDPGDDRPDEEQSIDRPEHRDTAWRAAAGSFVLLRNEGKLLPLDPASMRTIAVIGPNAGVANIQGGGSARVTPRGEVTPLDGIRARFGDAEVEFERGCTSHKTIPAVETRHTADRSGFTIEYFANDAFAGEPVRIDRMPRGYHMWLGEWADDVPASFTARSRAVLVVDEPGEWTLSLASAGRSRLLLDGALVVDNWEPVPGEFFFGLGSGEVSATRELEADRRYELVAEFQTTMPGFSGMQIGLLPPMPGDLMERAAAAAARADVAVVVVGTNSDWESEGHDRTALDLPLRQRELIERVMAANPRTIVAVNAGAPVDVEWAERAGAVLWCWLPGQAWGDALAAVLAGDADPGGRLPTTLPRRTEDTPAFTNYPGEGGEVRYGEGVFMGYRWYDARRIEPAYCFGHGLSYAEFEYGPIELSSDQVPAPGETLRATVTVRNTSSRAGTEVVQCYVHDPVASVARPPQELGAFAKVELAPGETRGVTLELDEGAFAFWSPAAGAWTVEPGRFELRVGRSSRDIRATATVTA
jgi:beta-glucosidase